MKQGLTEEQLEHVREALKNNDYIEFDEDDKFDSLDLALSISRKQNKYFFSSKDQYFDESFTEIGMRQYEVRLDLVDTEREENVIANIAYMDIRISPMKRSDLDIIIDDDEDSFDTLIGILELDEMEMDDKYEDYYYSKYPSSRICVAELHTFYVSPEYRGLGIADFMYGHLNDLFYAEYNQIIYLLGVYLNPIKEQVLLNQVNFEHLEYCNNDIDENVLKSMMRSLEKNGFKKLNNPDGRHYYMNMFDLDIGGYIDENDFYE